MIRFMTRRSLLIAGGLVPALRRPSAGQASPHDYPVSPIPLTQVEIHDEFWTPRIEANRAVSIWHCFERTKDGGEFNISKLIEAAAFMLAKRPDGRLRGRSDEAKRSRISHRAPTVRNEVGGTRSRVAKMFTLRRDTRRLWQTTLASLNARAARHSGTHLRVPVSTKSTLRLPHCEHTSRLTQSRTGRSAP